MDMCHWMMAIVRRRSKVIEEVFSQPARAAVKEVSPAEVSARLF